MIYENPAGSVYFGVPSYGDLGFSWAYYEGYWATAPPYQLAKSGGDAPYGDSFPINFSENVVWSGSQKTDQPFDGLCHYWDSVEEDWVYLPDGKGFTLRPYYFRYLYDPKDFMVSISTTVSTGTNRAHWKNLLEDSTNNMHLCPLFLTPKGLALPSYSDAATWNFPSYQSGSAGLSILDCSVWLSNAPYPVAGLCVLGLMNSETAGGLINDRTEVTSSAWIGQTDGYFSAVVNGRPVGYIGVTPWDPVFRPSILATLPWSGQTIKEVCSVDIGSVGVGGIFK